MNNDRTIRPSLWYCSLGVAVILAGMGLFLYTAIHGIMHVTDGLTQIIVPGAKDLALKPKLNYTIFLETESVVDGRIYSTSESLSGLACTVTSRTSGSRIVTRSPRVNTTYSMGGREGKSVLEFTTQEEGVYQLNCDYETGVTGPQAVVAVASGMAERIFSTVIEGLSFFFGGGIFGGGIIAAVFILRERAKRRLTLPNPTTLKSL